MPIAFAVFHQDRSSSLHADSFGFAASAIRDKAILRTAANTKIRIGRGPFVMAHLVTEMIKIMLTQHYGFVVELVAV
jgi:hypothetical protein